MSRLAITVRCGLAFASFAGPAAAGAGARSRCEALFQAHSTVLAQTGSMGLAIHSSDRPATRVRDAVLQLDDGFSDRFVIPFRRMGEPVKGPQTSGTQKISISMNDGSGLQSEVGVTLTDRQIAEIAARERYPESSGVELKMLTDATMFNPTMIAETRKRVDARPGEQVSLKPRIELSNHGDNQYFWFRPEGFSELVPARVLDLHEHPTGFIVLAEFVRPDGRARVV